MHGFIPSFASCTRGTTFQVCTYGPISACQGTSIKSHCSFICQGYNTDACALFHLGLMKMSLSTGSRPPGAMNKRTASSRMNPSSIPEGIDMFVSSRRDRIQRFAQVTTTNDPSLVAIVPSESTVACLRFGRSRCRCLRRDP